MRRAAVQALRTARRTPVRRLLNSRTFPICSNKYALGLRSTSATAKRDGPSLVLESSMYFRNFSVATLVAALVGGTWFYQREAISEQGGLVNSTSPTSGASSPGTFQTSALLASIPSQTLSPQALLSNPVSEPAAESTRRALIVEDDQFYVRDLSDDRPLSKGRDDTGGDQLDMLTPEQATHKLRRNEESYTVGRGRGVVRYDVVQLPSNNPIEDDHAEKIVEVPQTVTPPQEGSPSSDWMFWGVFDGHSGWTTSAKLRQVLISFVARELNQIYKSALIDPSLTFPTPEAIDTAIKRGFLRLDHEIVHESVEKVTKMNSKPLAAEILAPALSGSCALLSFYDSRSKIFRVACTGDSRAVLGRRGNTGKWIATPLSEDQTGGTPAEMARLRAEHPGEQNVVRNGRILGGLEPSRAFGDSFYKWSQDVQLHMKKSFFGRNPSPLLKTPPYVTAEPVITTTKMQPEKGDFVVLATDGLWEMLTNEEVVGLVGQWLESHPLPHQNASSSSSSWSQSWFGGKSQTALPVEKPLLGTGERSEGQRQPLRQEQWQIKSSDERFVVEDKNAATHLVRNALGGRNRDIVCALLTLPSPYSRRYRYVWDSDLCRYAFDR